MARVKLALAIGTATTEDTLDSLREGNTKITSRSVFTALGLPGDYQYGVLEIWRFDSISAVAWWRPRVGSVYRCQKTSGGWSSWETL